MEQDLEAWIEGHQKGINYNDNDGTGPWYVVKKLDGTKATERDGAPIIAKSHETAYRIGFNIGLRDCMWWCPVRVEEYEQKYGGDRSSENTKHVNPENVGATVVQILESRDLEVEEVVMLVKRPRGPVAYNLYGGR